MNSRANKLLDKMKSFEQLSKNEILNIVEQVRVILIAEPGVLQISDSVNVIGDLHGQYYDFLHILELVNSDYTLLFLGDYVDRGYNSLEVVLFILLLKIQRPGKVFLLRGNHENRAQTAVYGFKTECLQKYDHFVYWKICEIFEYFCLAAVVNDTYFCVHGGIFPELSLEMLSSTDRMGEFCTASNALWGGIPQRKSSIS
ncbi:serine/threonine-protein phosphatase 4 catalytic subunit [Enteropsectra breve]|nr:serine/threonine-protein phosphatase 4 catalytic subunit [Enteropsectra breve]